MPIFSKKDWIFLFFGLLTFLFFANIFVKNYLLLGFSNSRDFSASLADSLNASVIKEEKEEPIEENIILASEVKEAPHILTEQEKQNILDDIQEKLDIIQEEINELTNKNNPVEAFEETDEPEETEKSEEIVEDEEDKTQEKVVAIKHTSSGASIIYPKILINEIQISPIGDRFIELYNPTSQNINLTDWYLQRKIKTSDTYSSSVSSTLFAGKIIGSNDYFLISSDYDRANILHNLTLTEDNSFILKNPNGEISDKFGFGGAQDFESAPFPDNPPEGQSLGRKFDETSQSYQDTGDNSADFELNIPTPKTKNIKYVAPPPIKNILINEVQVSPIGQRFIELYNPNSIGINLTGWYLQRRKEGKDEWESLVSSTKFSGIILGSNDYFLISKEIEGSDIFEDKAFKINEGLRFKKSLAEVSDEINLGSVPDGKSIGRDSEDNFIIFDVPTPKKENK